MVFCASFRVCSFVPCVWCVVLIYFSSRVYVYRKTGVQQRVLIRCLVVDFRFPKVCVFRAALVPRLLFRLCVVKISLGKPVPNNVSSKSLVRTAKKEARQAEKKDEDKPLAKVTVGVKVCR